MTMGVNSSSSGLTGIRTYDSVTTQCQSDFVNTPPARSTVELPTNIYAALDSSPKLNHLPLFRTPRPIDDDLVPFFLSYHRQHINYGHYFWYCDPLGFINEGLLDLATQSESLQYAIASFSALIYSIQLDQSMKRFTFLFYAKAIGKLRQVVNTDSIEIYTTVATILELASIEVRPSCGNWVLIIADYPGCGKMLSTCERRSPNPSVSHQCHEPLFLIARSPSFQMV